MNTPSNHAEVENPSRPKFRRRHYLIDRRRQLAATVRIAGLVLVLLITINAMIAWQSHSYTSRVMVRNPNLGEHMRASDLRNLVLLAGFSLIIFAMVVVRSVMYTHRTAGAVFHVGRCMEKIAAGDFDVTLKLRQEDSLRDLEEPFNRMAKALAQRAGGVEEHGSPVDAETP